MKLSGTKASNLSWLTEVRESKQPLTELSPIWVRHGVIKSGPTIPYPEVHPYCEFSTTQKGTVKAFVGQETMEVQGPIYFMAGPGLAHWYEGLKYPVRFIAIYFAPSLLVEMGPIGDGMQVLRRFTAKQTLAQRLILPPPQLALRFKAGFAEAVREFDQKSFGYEMRLRALLVEMLVQLLRWERKTGKEFKVGSNARSWPHIAAALKYMSQNFAEDIYARDLATAAGVSESRLKVLFQEVLGMPWTQYLSAYRIHRAAALLCQPGHNVLEVSLAVGFQTLSHFNATFRSVMGINPGQYAKRAAGKSLGPKRILGSFK